MMRGTKESNHKKIKIKGNIYKQVNCMKDREKRISFMIKILYSSDMSLLSFRSDERMCPKCVTWLE